MKTAKLVIGIICICLFLVVTLQSCAVGIGNTLFETGEVSGTAGFFVAIFFLAGGIVSVAGRKSRGAAIADIVLFALGAVIGFANAGTYSDLNIWSGLCLTLAVFFAISLFAQNYSKTKSKNIAPANPEELQQHNLQSYQQMQQPNNLYWQPIYVTQAPAKKSKRNPFLTFLMAFAIFLAIFLVFFICIILIMPNDQLEAALTISASETEETNSKTEASTEQVLINDSFVKVTYVKIGNVSGVENVTYLTLLIENKSNKKINVLLDDLYVDNVQKFSMRSGLINDIEPGKSAKDTFSLLDTVLDDVGTVEFKVNVLDENYNSLETTDAVKVNK